MHRKHKIVRLRSGQRHQIKIPTVDLTKLIVGIFLFAEICKISSKNHAIFYFITPLLHLGHCLAEIIKYALCVDVSVLQCSIIAGVAGYIHDDRLGHSSL